MARRRREPTNAFSIAMISPSPMEGGTLCDFPLAQLSGFPDHEEHFPLYTGAAAGGHGGEHQAAWSSVSHSGLENC